MDDNFELRKAFHEVQVAQNEMEDSRIKMLKLQTEQNESYHRINEMQEQYSSAKEEQDAAWEQYKTQGQELYRLIGESITSGKEAAKLEESMKLMASDPDEEYAKTIIYLKGAEFFGRLNLENMTERDRLISKKRNLVRPDNSKCEKMLAFLKKARTEHAEILERYHAAKNDYSLKKANYDRLNAKYLGIKHPNTYEDGPTSRPVKIYDENLLKKAGVPNDEWDKCDMERRADGKVDIYYGMTDTMTHGHIVMNGETVEYAREPAAR